MEIILHKNTGTFEAFPDNDWKNLYLHNKKLVWRRTGVGYDDAWIHFKNARIASCPTDTHVDLEVTDESSLLLLEKLEMRCRELISGKPLRSVVYNSFGCAPRIRLFYRRGASMFTTSSGEVVPYSKILPGGFLTGRFHIQSVTVMEEASSAAINLWLGHSQYTANRGGLMGGGLRPVECLILDI